MRRPSAALAFLLAVAAPVAAAAAEHATQVESHHEPGQWLNLIFAFINFFLFVFILQRVAAKPLRDFLEGRRVDVSEAMSQAEQAKAEADRLRREYEAKAAGLEEMRDRMIAEIKHVAEQDRDRILAEARASAERLEADAERRAQSELARARQELRAEAARLATELAEKEIRSQLGAEDRRRLLDDFLEGLPQ